MSIYITGDTHGEKLRFWKDTYIPRVMKPGDYLIICGDFGYLFFNNETENNYLDELEQMPYTILFCDGNHENFYALNKFPVKEWNGGKVHFVRKNIIHLMRGQIYNIEGQTFFTMGGAYSIDRDYRVLGYTYWEEEIPTVAEINAALDNLAEKDFKVDYIITHTCPRKFAESMADTLLDKDGGLLDFFDYIRENCEYKHWFFGHWHEDRKINKKTTAVYYRVIKIAKQKGS